MAGTQTGIVTVPELQQLFNISATFRNSPTTDNFNKFLVKWPLHYKNNGSITSHYSLC